MANKLSTVILLTYNQEKYVQKAIEGALAQTYSPLEIIISDDASSDSTWETIHSSIRCYQGPHKILVRRNPQNLGINRHFNKLMNMVNGNFIVIMAGDDISEPDRVKTSIRVMEERNAYGMFSNGKRIDIYGKQNGYYLPLQHKGDLSWLSLAKSGLNGAAGFSMAWRKSVWDAFSKIPEHPLGEDAFIPFRCALLGNFSYHEESLVSYREHDSNASFWKKKKSTKSSKDYLNVVKDEITHYLMMNRSRLIDIKTALKLGILKESDAELAKQILEEHIMLTSEKIRILDYKMPRLLWNLFRTRYKYRNTILGYTVLKQFYVCLSYKTPMIYHILQSILKMTRKGGKT